MLAQPSLAALDRQRLASQPPTRLESPEDVTGCHSPGGLFYNKYISIVSAKYQLSVRSLLLGECIIFVVRRLRNTNPTFPLFTSKGGDHDVSILFGQRCHGA